MAVDRPTFDENWHRIAELKPRLRSVVQVYRQRYRNQKWYVLRDPGNNQSFRVDEVAWRLLALLDGHRTIAEAWRVTNEQFGDRSPTQGEVLRLLGQLYTSNLLHSDMSKDARGMFERFKRRRQREVGGYIMNLLFARFPIFDPDAILDRLRPMFGWLFGPVGFVLWAIVIATGLYHLAGRAPALFDQAQGVLQPDNLLYLYLCFAGIKLLHELGHGIACKQYGQYENNQGEVHTLGIMLLVLTPVPYVDASSAWVFRSKWRRVMVGAAGMYVELAVAAIAAVIWSRTAEGTAIHALAYNLIFIGSVSTLLFNANPLLRFDGYFILSDLLEMPNLNQRSKQWLYYVVRRYIYCVQNPLNPAHSKTEQIVFPIYGISAFVYRIFIGIVIVLFVAETLPFIGVVMGALALITWIITPLVKFAHYLLTSPELQRTRSRSIGVTGVALATPLALIALVPVASFAYAPGVIEARRQVAIYAETSGTLQRALGSGIEVALDQQVLAEFLEPELLFQRQALEASQRELYIRMAQALAANKESVRQAYAAQLQASDVRLARIQKQIDSLQIKSPIQGYWLTPDLNRKIGAQVKRGDPLGMVATLDDLVVTVAADQWNGPRLIQEAGPKAVVDMRIDGWPDTAFSGRISRVLPAGSRRLPSQALGMAVGGRVMNKIDAQSGDEVENEVFEIVIDVDPKHAEGQKLMPGQRVMVRFPLQDQTLLTKAWIYVSQIFQQRLSW